jgi:membrane-bound lytic murein transglycosylase D
MTQTQSNASFLKHALLICFATLFFGGFLNAQVTSSDEPTVGSLETDIDSTSTRSDDHRIPWFTNQELTERLNSLPFGCVRPQLTGAVRGYINTYAVRKRAKCESMLGRRILYFPMYEKYLKAAGMPSELKYLSVTESALNPTIVSSAGAMGLWQFMPATGKEYGLDITKAIDERCDPNKSTQAAVKYLQRLYIQFGSWELALAAYNSGAGRVRSAIKRSHSTNFWRLQHFLPEETRNYVPAFIAAMYICHYFDSHNLTPESSELEAQMTSSVQVFETLTFSEIGDATGISNSIIKLLNPAYRQNYIPNSAEGHYLILPSRVMPAFLRWANGRGGRQYLVDAPIVFAQGQGSLMSNNNYMLSNYRPQSGETLESVASLFGSDVEYLKIWNNSPWGGIVIDQPMRVYQPYSVLERKPIKIEGSKVAAADPKKPTKKTTDKPGDKNTPAAQKATLSTAKPPFHVVQRGESLDDIAVQYGLSTNDLLVLNPKVEVKIGVRVKLRN